MLRKIVLCMALLTFCFAAQVMAEDKLNINSATPEQLAESPCIGPDLAKKIVEYRENVGDFNSPDDLKEVDGIDDAKIGEIQKNFDIEAATADCNC